VTIFVIFHEIKVANKSLTCAATWQWKLAADLSKFTHSFFASLHNGKDNFLVMKRQ
jgi:hypothetical protein